MPTAGQLLVASPGLHGAIFDKTVILLLEHDESGSMGLILNRPSGLLVSEALPGLGRVADPEMIFLGGPVEEGTALVLADATITAVELHYRCGSVGLVDVSTVDLDDDPPDGRYRVFSGYSGWSPGQLDAELREQAWIVADAVDTDAWQGYGDEFWSDVLRRQPGPTRFLSSYPDDPSMN